LWIRVLVCRIPHAWPVVLFTHSGCRFCLRSRTWLLNRFPGVYAELEFQYHRRCRSSRYPGLYRSTLVLITLLATCVGCGRTFCSGLVMLGVLCLLILPLANDSPFCASVTFSCLPFMPCYCPYVPDRVGYLQFLSDSTLRSDYSCLVLRSSVGLTFLRCGFGFCSRWRCRFGGGAWVDVCGCLFVFISGMGGRCLGSGCRARLHLHLAFLGWATLLQPTLFPTLPHALCSDFPPHTRWILPYTCHACWRTLLDVLPRTHRL
jgi:hypothetical protein